MTRTSVSEDELLKWLNSRLGENEDLKDCQFSSILLLAEEDKYGCNWSHARLRCSGVSVEVCKLEAMRIVAEAKKRFNVT
jgi:hypothetical protein